MIGNIQWVARSEGEMLISVYRETADWHGGMNDCCSFG